MLLILGFLTAGQRSVPIEGLDWWLSSRCCESSPEPSSPQIESVAICETVQKNLRSRSYFRGRYSVKQEKGVRAFHRMYAQVMGGGGRVLAE